MAKKTGTITVTLIRSLSKCLPRHKACALGLGLRGRINQTVTLKDTPETRGMINAIRYLLDVKSEA